MTEFRNLPQQFSVGADDEFLVVGASGPHRITTKALRYDSLALLKFKHPGDQNYGIGTADTWVNIPFNELTLTGVSEWLQLNADGSFSLAEGYYFLQAEVEVQVSNRARLALKRGSDFLEVSKTYAGVDAAGPRGFLRLSKTFYSTGQTFSVEIAVESPSLYTISGADLFLAGIQTSLCSCEIHKLG